MRVIPYFKPASDTAKNKKTIKKRQKVKYTHQEKLKFSRSLKYDSSFALMTVNSFSKGHLEKFFRQSFRDMRKKKTKNLVIDIRANGGGDIIKSVFLTRYFTQYVLVSRISRHPRPRGPGRHHQIRGVPGGPAPDHRAHGDHGRRPGCSHGRAHPASLLPEPLQRPRPRHGHGGGVRGGVVRRSAPPHGVGDPPGPGRAPPPPGRGHRGRRHDPRAPGGGGGVLRGVAGVVALGALPLRRGTHGPGELRRGGGRARPRRRGGRPGAGATRQRHRPGHGAAGGVNLLYIQGVWSID